MVAFIRALYIIFMVSLLGGAGLLFWNLEQSSPEISYVDFVTSLKNGEVSEVRFKGREIRLTDVYDRQFRSYVPDVAEILPILAEKRVAVYGANEKASLLWNLLTISIPVLIIMLAWLLKHPSKILPIIGTINPARIKAAKQALDIDYSREDWYRLLEVRNGYPVP